MTAAPALDLADTDTPSTLAWLAQLTTYEETIKQERRMALFTTAARTIDRETGEVTRSADAAAEAAWRYFVGTLTGWQAHATEARAMIALLDGALTTLEGLPTADCAGWARGCGLYLRLRYQPVGVRPLPPLAPWRDWSWGVSLATWRTEAYRDHLVPTRHAYLLLAAPAKRAAREEFAIGDPSDILHTVFPVEELHTLDYRAGTLCVDTRVRLDLENRWLLASQAKKKAGRR